MDYHDNSAGTARLAVIKYAATVPNKAGTLFFNPGDPLRLPFVSSTNIQSLQVAPAVQDSTPSQRWEQNSAKLLRVLMT